EVGSQSITLETGCWIADKLTTFLPFSFLVDGCAWVEGSSVYSSTYSYSSSMLKKFLNVSFILIVTASFLTISDKYRAESYMCCSFFNSNFIIITHSHRYIMTRSMGIILSLNLISKFT